VAHQSAERAVADLAPANRPALAELPAERTELRRRHVGSSEVAALFNLSPHTTRLQLYLRKRGELPPELAGADAELDGNERIFWGVYLEPAIGQGVADRMGWSLRKVRRYVAHPGVPGMGCSLDFEIVQHPRGPGVLEVKTVDRATFRQWEAGRPPIHYELQLQHQLACTGRAWGALGILVGGNELRVVPYLRHEAAIARLEREVELFWREVDEGRPPAPVYEADLATLKALYRDAAGGSFLDLRDDQRARELCETYAAAADEERCVQLRKRAAEAELLDMIRQAETVWVDGFKISAGTIGGGPVAYERAPYRSFRISKSFFTRNRRHDIDPGR
jgi:predicted phage-related endonuclease